MAVVELDKTSGCGPEDRGFETRLSPQMAWLAGLLEGEGSFLKPPPSGSGPIVTMETTDLDTATRVADIFGVHPVKVKPRKKHHKVPWRVSVSGCRAVLVMERLYSTMSRRRQEQIDAALFGWEQKRRLLLPEEKANIVARYRGGERAVVLAEEFGVRRESIHKIVRRAK